MKQIQTIRARRRLPSRLTPISPVKIKKIERRSSSRDVIRRAVGTWIHRRMRQDAALKIERVYVLFRERRAAARIIERFYCNNRYLTRSGSTTSLGSTGSDGSIKDRRGMKLESLRIVENALMNAEDMPVPPPTPIKRENVFAFKENVPKSDRCVIC